MESIKAYETPSGPQLEVLGEVETRLPTPLKKRGTGRAILAVAVVVSVLALGGVKLKGEYSSVSVAFSRGGERESDSIAYNLQQRQDAAANIITIGKGVLGESAVEIENAQQALDALKTARAEAGPAEQYTADSALGKAVDLLYQTLQGESAAADKAQALQSQWSEFLSRRDRISKTSYNEDAQAYNKMVSGFPARLIAGLWNCTEVELFA